MIVLQFNDLKELKADIKKAKKNVKFGLVVGITRTAKKAQLYEQARMLYKFKAPKPFTVNSVFVKSALKKHSVPYAIVGLKQTFKPNVSGAGEYLEAEIEGGRRKLKPFERMMNIKGKPRRFMPSKYERLNSYGNMAKARVKNITKGVDKKLSSGKYKFFSKTRKGFVTIYEKDLRSPSKIKPVMVEVTPNYQALFDFYKTGRKAVDENYSKEITAGLRYAFATSK